MIPMNISDTERVGMESRNNKLLNKKKHNNKCSKVPIRELPDIMPRYQHPLYPELYTIRPASQTCYRWDAIILDLDRTIIHGKRLSAKRWKKYVENGTIPSLAENQNSKWDRHIHRKGHQMHPFIRGRTMIYYRPYVWHLLAVLDYLKSHFKTKIIICTKAGEHYAASVLSALLTNYTSANPDLIDDVYNFHDLHDDPHDDGKPKKPFSLICNRHELKAKKVLIVDDNALSWFGEDRKVTNFWMPPCYGYQIHSEDNELQLLCKYLWDPIQQNHFNKKQNLKNNDKHHVKSLKQKVLTQQQLQQQLQQQQLYSSDDDNVLCDSDEDELRGKGGVYDNNLRINNPYYQGDTTDSSISPETSPKIFLKENVSPKYLDTKPGHHVNNQKYLNPNINQMTQNGVLHGIHGLNEPNGSKLIKAYSIQSLTNDSVVSSVSSYRSDDEPDNIVFYDDNNASNHNVTTISHISRNYNKRQYKLRNVNNKHHHHSVHNVNNNNNNNNNNHHHHNHHHNNNEYPTLMSSQSSPVTRTKKKNYFFETKSRGSKKLAKLIGK